LVCKVVISAQLRAAIPISFSNE